MDTAASPSQVPQSIRNIGYLIKEIGLSTCVVLFLLGQDAGWVPSQGKHEHEQITQVLSQNQRILAQTQQHMIEQRELTRGMCLNGAATEIQKARCEVM